MKKNYSIFAILLLLLVGGVSLLTTCKKTNDTPAIQYIETIMGGCYGLGDSKDYEEAELPLGIMRMTVTTASDTVHLRWLAEYRCGAEIETQCKMENGVLCLYIFDPDLRVDEVWSCVCYYTYEFVFRYWGNIFDQKYKIMLVYPEAEKPIVSRQGSLAEHL